MENSSKLATVQIAGTEIRKIEYQGQQVVTFAMIDIVHGRVDGTARKRFNDNKERFTQGEDYITLDQASEIRTLGFTRPQGGYPASVVLVTKRGYLKIAKTLGDDKAWEVFDEMIERYFAVEQLASLAPEIVEQIRRSDGISRQLNHKVTTLGRTLDDLSNRVNALLINTDARVAALEYVSVRELLNEARAVQRRRGGLNRKIGHELQNGVLLAGGSKPCRRCPHSGVWLYQRDFATRYMKERGNSLVAEHNARQLGQGVLAFTPAPPNGGR